MVTTTAESMVRTPVDVIGLGVDNSPLVDVMEVTPVPDDAIVMF